MVNNHVRNDVHGYMILKKRAVHPQCWRDCFAELVLAGAVIQRTGVGYGVVLREERVINTVVINSTHSLHLHMNFCQRESADLRPAKKKTQVAFETYKKYVSTIAVVCSLQSLSYTWCAS